MTDRYSSELKQLSVVYDAAVSADIDPIVRTVATWAERPMIMAGSGGSFSTASFAAFLHEQVTGRLARAATPLELSSGGLPDAGVACFSANGRNHDIIAAFRNASRREVDPLSALVLADDSPLAQLASRCRSTPRRIQRRFLSRGLAVGVLRAARPRLPNAHRQRRGHAGNAG